MRSSILVAVFVLCSASSALARQTTTPAFDVSGGYSFLRDNSFEENLHGWLASVGFNINESLGIVGEVGANYKSLDVVGIDVADLTISSFMAGPRFAVRGNPKFTPYGQVLLGAARASGDIFEVSDSSTEFALQPGAGIDIWFMPNVGVRVGGDYRRVFSEDEGTNEFRFHVGIVFSGGSR